MTQAKSFAANDTWTVIIEAAYACFRNYGLRKTTIVDIVRAAGVSRSTFYEYFPDKASIVEACAEGASQEFYRNMSESMNRGDTLEDKLCRAAVFVTKARQVIEPEEYFDQDEVNLMLTKNAAVLLQECGDFLAPYLAAGKLTGEIRKDLDVQAAAEWFSRILFSLFTTPSPRFDMHDGDAVAEFVRAHIVRGFIDDRPARPRRAPNAS